MSSDLQYYPITLPGARLYPPDVSILQLGPNEVENYYIIKKTASVTALRQLITNTLKGVTVEELYEPDFLFTLYWHRVNSYMNFPYNLPWTCPACEDSNLSKLDLTQIVSPSVPDDYPADGATLDLPCGLQMTFRLPKETDDVRASDQVRLLQIQDANESHYRKAELLCMLDFDSNFDPMEKWDIINKIFTPEDIFVIDGFKNTFRFGPENIMNCKCGKCGKQVPVSFRFSILEFFPNDTDKSAVRGIPWLVSSRLQRLVVTVEGHLRRSFDQWITIGKTVVDLRRGSRNTHAQASRRSPRGQNALLTTTG